MKSKSMNVYLLLNRDHRETPKTAETRGVPRAVPMHHDANQPPKPAGEAGRKITPSRQELLGLVSLRLL